MDELNIGTKTLSKWDKDWKSFGKLSCINFNELNGHFGIYRFYLHNELVYLGVASEINSKSNSGFRKRLTDYIRPSNSARKSKAGQRIYANRDEIDVEIIDIGQDQISAIIACMLEYPMIAKHRPGWNKRHNSRTRTK